MLLKDHLFLYDAKGSCHQPYQHLEDCKIDYKILITQHLPPPFPPVRAPHPSTKQKMGAGQFLINYLKCTSLRSTSVPFINHLGNICLFACLKPRF